MKFENKNPYFTRSPTHLGFECIVQKSQASGRQNPRVWNLEQSFSTSYKLKQTSYLNLVLVGCQSVYLSIPQMKNLNKKTKYLRNCLKLVKILS